MLARTGSVALIGVDAHLVDVEVDVNVGVPKFTIVGLPAKSVCEAEQRTRSALQASSERWPPARIVANLAPAALRKQGTHFDLPIAVALIAGDGRLDPSFIDRWVLMGELGLDGSVRRVRGVLPAALACRDAGLEGLICPRGNFAEAAVVDGIEVVPVASLAECADFLRGKGAPSLPEVSQSCVVTPSEDMSDVRGQHDAKRAVEIAAAGSHNLLMKGAPGSGKTMLARRMPGILPTMSLDESLEVTRVHSVAGLLPEGVSLLQHRPFRSPHHGVSMAGLIGGGTGSLFPGESSLAHRGVLFLDELPLYRRDVLESLRGPVEDGVVRIARTTGTISYPCRFSLIAAMNPCPCGYASDDLRSCRCSERGRARYLSRLSGPLLDRFDMQVETSRLTKRQLLGGPDGETSETIRARVDSARRIQAVRYRDPAATNASVDRRVLDAHLRITPRGREELTTLIDGIALTGRALTRILRVARTIADIRGGDEVDREDVAEAVMLRFLDEDMEVAA